MTVITINIQGDDVSSTLHAPVTVGSGGNFATLNEALDYLMDNRGAYDAAKIAGEIQLLTGFVMAEQVINKSRDMGWIRITSVDATVTIDRAALTVLLPGANNYAAFTGYEGAVLPVIGALFVMNTTGTAAQRGGIFVWKGSGVNIESECGVKNCGGRGLHVSDSSWAAARFSEFDGCGEFGLRVANGSTASVRGINLRNSGVLGAAIADGSSVQMNECFFSGSARAISVQSSIVYAVDAVATGITGEGATVFDGGILNAQNLSMPSVGGSRAVSIFRGGQANIAGANLSGATQDAISCDGGYCSAGGASLQNAGRFGVLANNGGHVSAPAAVTTGAGSTGFRVQNGSTISCFGGTGTISKAKNSLDFNGVIYTDI